MPGLAEVENQSSAARPSDARRTEQFPEGLLMASI
jgi:hypothetical protein